MTRFFDYLYILATILLTVYGQLIMKWRITQLGQLPSSIFDKVKFLITLIFDPYIFSGFLSAFLASLTWMAAMTKFDLSHAYPFMSLNFGIVLLLSGWLLSEQLTFQKFIGVILIVIGTVVSARG